MRECNSLRALGATDGFRQRSDMATFLFHSSHPGCWMEGGQSIRPAADGQWELAPH